MINYIFRMLTLCVFIMTTGLYSSSIAAEKISLNFQKIELRAVLQLLADLSDSDLIISDSVNGEVSLQLSNTTWHEALDLILTTQGLAHKKIGKVLLIASAEEIIAQEQEQQILAPLSFQLFPVHYADAPDIVSVLQQGGFLSERAQMGSDMRSNSIWILDTPAQLARLDDVIPKLDQPLKQVLIEAQIVLATQSFSRELGIRYRFDSPAEVMATTDPMAFNRRFTASESTEIGQGLAIGVLGNHILLDLELHTLETEGRGEVISRPHLLALSGQTATIESGEEIPFQESTSSGATSTTFKKAVLSLQVTPRITPDDHVLLALQVNQDTVSPTVTVDGTPGVNTKAIKTHVRVNNGETLVLGGIYKQSDTTTVERIPFLGELPALGALFRYEVTQNEQEELLIFITPRIL